MTAGRASAALGREWRASRAELAGILAAVAALALVMLFAGRETGGAWPTGREALCYWAPALGDPYAQSAWTAPLAYVYSPAFLQALAPLRDLPWLAFLATWTTILLLTVRWLSGARLFALAIVFAGAEIAGGNIHLLLAAAIVAGFRWPAAWAFVLLTKVTPGIGLVWFAARGEWRRLGIALAATAGVVLVSFALDPSSWVQWVGILVASADRTSGTWAAIPVPLALRMPAALLIVVWGARTDRPWTVPVAAMLALPALWFGSLSMLLACVPLRDRRAEPRDRNPGTTPRRSPVLRAPGAARAT